MLTCQYAYHPWLLQSCCMGTKDEVRLRRSEVARTPVGKADACAGREIDGTSGSASRYAKHHTSWRQHRSRLPRVTRETAESDSKECTAIGGTSYIIPPTIE